MVGRLPRIGYPHRVAGLSTVWAGCTSAVPVILCRASAQCETLRAANASPGHPGLTCTRVAGDGNLLAVRGHKGFLSAGFRRHPRIKLVADWRAWKTSRSDAALDGQNRTPFDGCGT